MRTLDAPPQGRVAGLRLGWEADSGKIEHQYAHPVVFAPERGCGGRATGFLLWQCRQRAKHESALHSGRCETALLQPAQPVSPIRCMLGALPSRITCCSLHTRRRVVCAPDRTCVQSSALTALSARQALHISTRLRQTRCCSSAPTFSRQCVDRRGIAFSLVAALTPPRCTHSGIRSAISARDRTGHPCWGCSRPTATWSRDRGRCTIHIRPWTTTVIRVGRRTFCPTLSGANVEIRALAAETGIRSPSSSCR